MKFRYRCSQCGAEYKITPDLMVCPSCEKEQKADEPLRGVLEVVLEGSAGKDFSVFDLLPVEEKYFPAIPVGNTPLWEPARLRERFDRPGLFIKDDTANPTGSFKDRASYLVAAFARQHGLDEIVLASTGNAGSSMSGVGAAAGLKVRLYLPATAPPAKMVQALQYGAQVIKVDGTYDDAYDLSMDWCKTKGGLSRNTAHNPMTIEGKKTVSLEIFQQMGGRVPDHLFVPVGDGVILSGVYKGFRDLKALGLADKIPVIHGIQAEGSSALTRALRQAEEAPSTNDRPQSFSKPLPSKTLADSISVDVPRGGYYALKQLLENSGKMHTIEDQAIVTAQKDLASWTGLFVEPAAAASYAGYLQVKDQLPPGESVVLLVTGSGLKDISTAMKGVTMP